jgi:predicted Rossmann fold nucleotide-binding protein DprA/Smf involved in DNA uptake
MAAAVSQGGHAVGITVDPLDRLVRRRDLRLAIAEDLLTLATPFHPAARWHAGNAMRRNRLIYALARAAVVVASSSERGGTRTGALENLASEWVPLHVRNDGSPGNRQLIAEGGVALSPVAVEQFDVARLTEPSQSSLLDPRDAPNQPRAHDGDDPFDAAWPILAHHLRTPLGERELAEKAHLELSQARAWLKRAVAEGLLEVTARPKRYALPAAAAEQLRLEDA